VRGEGGSDTGHAPGIVTKTDLPLPLSLSLSLSPPVAVPKINIRETRVSPKADFSQSRSPIPPHSPLRNGASAFAGALKMR